MSARSMPLVFFATLLLHCGPAPDSARPSTATPTPSTPAPATATPLPPGAVRLGIVPARSVATIRVHEQVANVALPGEAVLTTNAFEGSLVLLPDGTFAPGSAFAALLDTLKSDSDLRDEWIKINTLQTRQYPRAEFVPSRVVGAPLPLTDGKWAASVEGVMRIHGVERPLVWELRAVRLAGELRVRGSTSFRFGDYGMAVPANRLVLSVVDDVRLEIDLLAKEG